MHGTQSLKLEGFCMEGLVGILGVGIKNSWACVTEEDNTQTFNFLAVALKALGFCTVFAGWQKSYFVHSVFCFIEILMCSSTLYIEGVVQQIQTERVYVIGYVPE